jgi:hypothetical protein
VFVLLSQLSCSKRNPAPTGASLQRQLAGTWITERTPFPVANFQCTTIIDSDGNYEVRGQTPISNILHPFQLRGIFQIKDGWLIDTMTSHSDLTNSEQLPYVNKYQIVKLSDSELVLKYPAGEVLYRKEKN